ncbi:MAG: SUMF1/EgtB/PvdO family nonheme iron enzyme [Terriglobia bacterium]
MMTPAAVHLKHRSKRPLAAGGLVVLVVTVWMMHDYQLPLAPRARDLNRGRTWDHKSRVDSKGVAQVWVPPGCFEMGSDLMEDFSAHANETPRHTVCISTGFWLDRFEVTNESFLEFTRAGGFTERRYWSEEGWRMHEEMREPYPMLKAYAEPRQPRVKITWYEAEAYAAWRGGKLPTEAQWEWAARGPQSLRYPWGEKFMEGAANMSRLDLRCTRPVGSYPAGRSWCGADDMAGNVWEWVADSYDANAYRHALQVDPFTPPSGHSRVIRGGAWGGIPGGSASDLRSARREGWFAGDRKLSHGVRVIHPAT